MKTLNRALLAASAAACALAPAAIMLANDASDTAAAVPASLTQALALEDVRHALTRTSFAASPADLKRFIGQPRAALVAHILDDIGASDGQPKPDFTNHWRAPIELLFAKSETLAELTIGTQYVNLSELTAWWMVEAINTDSPFKEQMAMFWMDHFVTSFDAHEDSLMTARKFETVRETMGGSFGDMLRAQLRDPAMLVYLNNVENTAEAPNENLAREVLELFTLGQGRGYSEQDIREVARALTGQSVREDDGSFMFDPAQHDGGRKTIFGQTGAFNADDLPDLILSNTAFGPYIVEKMWRFFISDQPDPVQVAALTAQWRASGWDLPTLYAGILSTEGFWNPSNQGTLVKSPWELYIGFARTFGTVPLTVEDMHDVTIDGGQQAFLPPNVAGWNEGPAWITDATLAQRTATLREMAEVWTFDRYEPETATTAALPVSQTFTETSGLRVGLAGLDWVWTEVEDDWSDTGVSLTLYDVGFQGQTFQTVRFWIGLGEGEGESEPYFGIEAGACTGGCPLSTLMERVEAERDEEGEVYREFWLTPWEASDVRGGLASQERDFIAALIKAAPALIAQTRDDETWRYMQAEAEAEGLSVPSFTKTERVGKQIARAFAGRGTLTRATKAAPAIQWGTSPKGQAGLPVELLALAGTTDMNADGFEEQADAFYINAAQQRAALYQARLEETFADPDAWFDALPAQAQTSAGLEIALLPIRNPALATGDRAVEGLDDLLFALILDPRFQLK